MPIVLSLDGALRRGLIANFGNILYHQTHPVREHPVLYIAPLSVACIFSLFLLTFHVCDLVSHMTLQTFCFAF